MAERQGDDELSRANLLKTGCLEHNCNQANNLKWTPRILMDTRVSPSWTRVMDTKWTPELCLPVDVPEGPNPEPQPEAPQG